MSFRCGSCNEQVEAGEKQIKRVVKIRAKSYVGGGHGFETVKELALGKCCQNRVPMTPEKVFA